MTDTEAFPGGYLLEGMGYVQLKVDDLEAAIDFYERAVHLRLTERSATTAFLSGGHDHHWVRLDAGVPGRYRLGFEVVADAAFDVIADRLSARGIAWTEGGDVANDRIQRSLRFTDINGASIEVFRNMAQFPLAPTNPIVRHQEILHAVWGAANTREAFDFYHDVFGSRDSDWREDLIVFVRNADRYHHSMGFGTVKPPGVLDHFCFRVEAIDDVMRARNVALQLGVTLHMDVLRHAPSNGVSVYLVDPITGVAIEFVAEHRQIDDVTGRARVMPNIPGLSDAWNPHPDVIDARTPLLLNRR